MYMYRVTQLLANLGWVVLDFGCSTLCRFLPGSMGYWQYWLSSQARWWNIPNQPNPGSPGDVSPCRYFQKCLYLTRKHCCSLFLPLDVQVDFLRSDLVTLTICISPFCIGQLIAADTVCPNHDSMFFLCLNTFRVDIGYKSAEYNKQISPVYTTVPIGQYDTVDWLQIPGNY